MRRFPDGTGRLRHAVALLQVDAESANAMQHARRKRFTSGACPAQPAQPDLIAHRRVDQHVAEREFQPQQDRHAFSGLAMLFRAFGERAEMREQRALQRGRLGRARLDVGQ